MPKEKSENIPDISSDMLSSKVIETETTGEGRFTRKGEWPKETEEGGKRGCLISQQSRHNEVDGANEIDSDLEIEAIMAERAQTLSPSPSKKWYVGPLTDADFDGLEVPEVNDKDIYEEAEEKQEVLSSIDLILAWNSLTAQQRLNFEEKECIVANENMLKKLGKMKYIPPSLWSGGERDTEYDKFFDQFMEKQTREYRRLKKLGQTPPSYGKLYEDQPSDSDSE